MYDEVLAQRLGLIPLNVNPDLFTFIKPRDESTDLNTLVFELNVTCTKKKNAPALASNDEEKYDHVKVMSSDLVWTPQGDQLERIPEIKPVHGDIEIARLRPGDSISGIFHARKGLGQEHAKWSPVGKSVLVNLIIEVCKLIYSSTYYSHRNI
jgi:DNA-directed RNA polymerase I and III subunit RPAC1